MQIYEGKTNIMRENVAKNVKYMKAKRCSNKSISEAIDCSENDVMYICYDAAVRIKEDHSCAPWS